LRRAAAAALFTLAACAKDAPPLLPRPQPFAPPSGLTAALSPPADVELRWENHATEPALLLVEFRTNPADGFTLIAMADGAATTFRHPDLAPETTYSYRLRPAFGAPSAGVSVLTKTGTPAPGESDGPILDGKDAPVPGAIPLRDPTRIASAAPAEVTAELRSPTTVDIRWKDQASDEDGYLLEMASPKGPFRVVALLPSDSRSFRKTQLAPGATLAFRVRAFFYGGPSNVTSATTPPARR
jgi:hypothetical protein